MANNETRTSLGAALFGRAREAVIGILFSDPDRALHVREIARRTGFSAPTVASELRSLERLGVLLSEVAGRQVHYRADRACALFGELQGIAVKTWGIRGRIAAALENLEGVQSAFIFGSFAAGTAHARSDIDLIVIGSTDHAVLSEAASRVSSEIGRTVNAKLYRPAEWKTKLAAGSSFLVGVANGPKVFVVGDEEDLNGIGEPRSARRAKAAEPAPRYAARNRKSRQGGTRVRRGGKSSRRR
jgi:predicted nucleotidyltransferase